MSEAADNPRLSSIAKDNSRFWPYMKARSPTTECETTIIGVKGEILYKKTGLIAFEHSGMRQLASFSKKVLFLPRDLCNEQAFDRWLLETDKVEVNFDAVLCPQSGLTIGEVFPGVEELAPWVCTSVWLAKEPDQELKSEVWGRTDPKGKVLAGVGGSRGSIWEQGYVIEYIRKLIRNTSFNGMLEEKYRLLETLERGDDESKADFLGRSENVGLVFPRSLRNPSPLLRQDEPVTDIASTSDKVSSNPEIVPRKEAKLVHGVTLIRPEETPTYILRREQMSMMTSEPISNTVDIAQSQKVSVGQDSVPRNEANLTQDVAVDQEIKLITPDEAETNNRGFGCDNAGISSLKLRSEAFRLLEQAEELSKETLDKLNSSILPTQKQQRQDIMSNEMGQATFDRFNQKQNVPNSGTVRMPNDALSQKAFYGHETLGQDFVPRRKTDLIQQNPVHESMDNASWPTLSESEQRAGFQDPLGSYATEVKPSSSRSSRERSQDFGQKSAVDPWSPVTQTCTPKARKRKAGSWERPWKNQNIEPLMACQPLPVQKQESQSLEKLWLDNVGTNIPFMENPLITQRKNIPYMESPVIAQGKNITYMGNPVIAQGQNIPCMENPVIAQGQNIPCMENPVIAQGKNILANVLNCTSPKDENAINILTSESDVQLAAFLANTFRRSALMYNQRKDKDDFTNSSMQAFRRQTSENPAIHQGKNILSKVLNCTTPKDENALNILTSESDAQLATFLANTFRRSAVMFNQRTGEEDCKNDSMHALRRQTLVNPRRVNEDYTNERMQGVDVQQFVNPRRLERGSSNEGMQELRRQTLGHPGRLNEDYTNEGMEEGFTIQNLANPRRIKEDTNERMERFNRQQLVNPRRIEEDCANEGRPILHKQTLGNPRRLNENYINEGIEGFTIQKLANPRILDEYYANDSMQALRRQTLENRRTALMLNQRNHAEYAYQGMRGFQAHSFDNTATTDEDYTNNRLQRLSEESLVHTRRPSGPERLQDTRNRFGNAESFGHESRESSFSNFGGFQDDTYDPNQRPYHAINRSAEGDTDQFAFKRTKYAASHDSKPQVKHELSDNKIPNPAPTSGTHLHRHGIEMSNKERLPPSMRSFFSKYGSF